MSESTKASFSTADYVVFSASLVISLGIGVYQGIRGRGKGTSEFLMAKMSPVPVALSLIVGIVSAISILGNSSEMYFYGTQLWMNVVGLALGGILMCRFMQPIIFPLRLVSIYHYLGLRWETDILRKAATVMQTLNMTIYLGIALYAPSIALSSVTPIPTSLSIAVLGAVCTIYSTLGGAKAVVYTDTFQSFVMVAGVVAVIAQGCVEVGGGAEVWNIALENDRIEFFKMDPNPLVRHTFWSMMVFGIFFGLQMYGASQAQFQRWASVATLRQSYCVMAMAVGGLIFAWSLINFSGLVVFAVYAGCDPYTLKLISKTDQITAYFVVDKLGYLLGIPGLFVAAVYSGVLSTVSTILNSVAANIWEDLMKPFPFFGRTEPSTALLITKSISLVLGLIGIGLGFMAGSMGGLVQAAYSIGGAFGGPITGLFLTGMFTPWVGPYGAMAGVTVGLTLNLWVVIGSFLYGPPPEKLPLSIENCNDFAGTSTTISTTASYDNDTWYLSSVIGDASGPFDLRVGEKGADHDDVFPLYRLSYAYLLALGCLCTVVASSLASVFVGCTRPEQVPEHLVDKTCLRFYRWLRSSSKEGIIENDNARENVRGDGVSLERITFYSGVVNENFTEDENKEDGNIEKKNSLSGEINSSFVDGETDEAISQENSNTDSGKVN